MRKVGIKPDQILDYMTCQLGGFQNLGFTAKDLRNKMDKCRKDEIKNGDAKGALGYLSAQDATDPLFFFKYKVDEEDRLETLFWADGRSRMDYAAFGDVLVFDMTYWTNAYKKQFVILAVGGKCPISVVTDGDLAMRKAIRNIFPDARHRLCTWHLERNAAKNVHKPEFVSDFTHLMLMECEVEEFDSLWADMYHRGLARMRVADARVETATKHSTPVSITALKSLKQNGAEVYTKYIFKLFHDEIQLASPLIVARRVDELRHRLMKCCCMMFESFGLPCCHMIVVMKYEHLLVIPRSLLMRRWTRSARPASQLPTVPQISRTLTHTARYGILSSGYNLLSFYASHAQDSFEDARELEHQMTSWMRKRWEMGNKKECRAEVGEASSAQIMFGVGDPLVVKTKGNPGKNANAPKSCKPRKCRHCKVTKNGKRKTPSCDSPLHISKRLAITNIMTTSSLDQSTDMDCDVNVCTAGRSNKMSKRLTHARTKNDDHCKERGKRLSHADSDSVRRSKQLAIKNGISTSSLDQFTDRDYDGKVCTPGGPDKMSNRSTHVEIENDGDSEERSKRFSHGDSDGDCEERSNRSSHGESESDGDFEEMSNAESESDGDFEEMSNTESEIDGDLDYGPIKRPNLGSFAKRANWTPMREFFAGINAYKVNTTERVMVSMAKLSRYLDDPLPGCWPSDGEPKILLNGLKKDFVVLHHIFWWNVYPKPPRRSLDIDQAALLHAVYKGVKLDIGRMWWDTLYAAFTNNHPTASLPIGILLTRFMYACKVPILAGDKLADKKTTHIGRGTIGKSKGQSKIHRIVNNPVSLEGIHDMILTVQENQIEFYQMLKKVVRIVCRNDDPSDADTLDDE
ncbi:hypothetical protein RHSIM_Rhsim02G0074600 [Rhododendron simsii]|uniref:SWIM-type domain-containing protein n=1 Tax=Rhododendron simsii TaxID=118357 RepID=A0A834HF73_RHOSS|nr:hypothetical protein RHSIM_Rhsim02G0074600 [Rhododendron simsii]